MESPFEIESEIEHLVSKIIDKNTKLRFKKGFDEALKEAQSSNASKPIHEHLKKGLDDPYNFGKHLGYLIGFLRFHPRDVLASSEIANHFLESVNSLESFDDFHNFAKSKMQSWNKKIRPHFKDLEETEKRVYMSVLRWI